MFYVIDSEWKRYFRIRKNIIFIRKMLSEILIKIKERIHNYKYLTILEDYVKIISNRKAFNSLISWKMLENLDKLFIPLNDHQSGDNAHTINLYSICALLLRKFHNILSFYSATLL